MRDSLQRGLYEALVTRSLADRMAVARGQGATVDVQAVDAVEAHHLVGHYLAGALARVISSAPADERRRKAGDVARDVLAAVGAHVRDPGLLDPLADELELLLAVTDAGLFAEPPPRPEVPLGDHDLLVMARGEPAIGSEIRRELASADQVDLLCAFITWPGFRVLADPLLSSWPAAGDFG